jgi:hypothetical protein
MPPWICVFRAALLYIGVVGKEERRSRMSSSLPAFYFPSRGGLVAEAPAVYSRHVPAGNDRGTGESSSDNDQYGESETHIGLVWSIL